jgi:Cys-tRNA(Pro) deacylase
MAEKPPAAQALDELGIPYRLFVHPGPVQSLEQAAAERNQQPDQVVRSILFRLSEGEYALVLVAGPEQIPWKALRRHFGQSRLTLATPDEVLEQTGFQVGSVAPWGLPQPIPTYIEQGVLDQAELSVGSGRHGTAILIGPTDLLDSLPAAQKIVLTGA